MGQWFACLTEGPRCSLLTTNCYCSEVISDKVENIDLNFWHNLKQSWKLRECLWSNSDHDLPTEKAFGPPKVGFQASTNWGYSCLTCPISIHFSLLGSEPLSPIPRYSTSPLHVFLTFLSRTVSSCNSLRCLGKRSSIEGNWIYSSGSSINEGSNSLKLSTLTTQ